MARRKKGIPEINAASMADIAFMLLIFFLVTTTMSVDKGITRKLPPPVPPDAEAPKVKERNVLSVLVNKDNQVAVEGELTEIDALTQRVKEFIINPNDDPNLSEHEFISDLLDKEMAKPNPDKNKIETYKRILDEIGNVPKSKGVVSLQTDRATKYNVYIQVQDAIVKAFNELRDELAMQAYGKPYNELKEDQQKLIREIYPISLSEAEPRRVKTK